MSIKEKGNCFAMAYHKLLAQRDTMSEAAYNVIYTSLVEMYEEKLSNG